uniref:Uncharacterized protein n=1 Tax=Arundo donax TaxID=35708 RepID=A0A0A9E0U6_ARUDO
MSGLGAKTIVHAFRNIMVLDTNLRENHFCKPHVMNI